MSKHSFDPEIVKRVGVPASVIYQNIFFWVEKNAANGKNFHDGRYWTYNLIEAFGELFPYLSEKQIRTALQKLIDDQLILKEKHNDNRYDHTLWYSLVEPICLNGQNDVSKRENGNDLMGKSRIAPEGKTHRSQIKTNQKPNTGEVFVPLNGTNFARKCWQDALEEEKLPRLEAVIKPVEQNGVRGIFLPQEYPPKKIDGRRAFLVRWITSVQLGEVTDA